MLLRMTGSSPLVSAGRRGLYLIRERYGHTDKECVDSAYDGFGKRSPEIFQGIGRPFPEARISSVLPATPDNGSDDRGTESESRSRRVIDAGGKLLMPGLINLHNHVAMSLMRNYADDLPLMEWLADRVWPFEAKLTGDDVYLGARLGIAEMLLGGTTTFRRYVLHADRVAEAVLESGMRAVVCPAFIDTNYEAFERETVRLVERYAGADGGASACASRRTLPIRARRNPFARLCPYVKDTAWAFMSI